MIYPWEWHRINSAELCWLVSHKSPLRFKGRDMNAHHLLGGESMSHCGKYIWDGIYYGAIFGIYNLPHPHNSNSNHQMVGEHYSSSTNQWKKAIIIIGSLPSPLMEMENPSFTFAIGSVILTPCGPNDYNCLVQSYALHPNKAYYNHFQIDFSLVWVLS